MWLFFQMVVAFPIGKLAKFFFMQKSLVWKLLWSSFGLLKHSTSTMPHASLAMQQESFQWKISFLQCLSIKRKMWEQFCSLTKSTVSTCDNNMLLSRLLTAHIWPLIIVYSPCMAPLFLETATAHWPLCTGNSCAFFYFCCCLLNWYITHSMKMTADAAHQSLCFPDLVYQKNIPKKSYN